MEGVKTCKEFNQDGTICEESRTLEILEELQTLYAERLKRIDDEAGGDGVQLKMTTLESWVQDLTMQNAMLVHTVELLEHEASERVLLLQKRLQESSKSALEYMTKVQDYDSQMQEATGEKIRSQSQQISTRNQLILAAENEDALKSRIVRLEKDIGSLLELIRRVREDNTWSVEGLHFYEVSYEDIFGYQTSTSLAADQHPYVSSAFVKRKDSVSINSSMIVAELKAELMSLRCTQEQADELITNKEQEIQRLVSESSRLKDDLLVKERQIQGFVKRLQELHCMMNQQMPQGNKLLGEKILSSVGVMTEPFDHDTAEAQRLGLEAALWCERVTKSETEILRTKCDLKRVMESHQTEVLKLTKQLQDYQLRLNAANLDSQQLHKQLEATKKQVSQKTDEVACLQKKVVDMDLSARDMRTALTAEVAEKHDQILAYRRESQQMEEQVRQADMQTHFKDDIIREMRKDIKMLRARVTALDPSYLDIPPDNRRCLASQILALDNTSSYQNPQSLSDHKHHHPLHQNNVCHHSEPSGAEKTCHSSPEKLQQRPRRPSKSRLSHIPETGINKLVELSRRGSPPTKDPHTQYPGKEVIQDRPTSELPVTWKEQPKTQMADQDLTVRSLKEKLAETQNELNQLKDKSDAYVSELNDAGKKQLDCERRVHELHNNLEECRKHMGLSLFRLTHAAADKNIQTEEWLIDAEEFRQKAEEGQATFNNLKAETDYLLHNLKSREKQVDNLENMIYSLKEIVVKSQTELSQVQVNATLYLKDKEAAERAQAQYRESIHSMKESLHLGQRQKDISSEKIMSISQEEVELNKPISLNLDSYTKVFDHNITAPDDMKDEMNKILESIKLKDKQIKTQDKRITELSQLLEEAQMNIKKIQKVANVHTNMEQEYEAKINKLQKDLIESKKQIEDLQRVEKKQENKLLDPKSVEIIYENKTDALSRANMELCHMGLKLQHREQEVNNLDELITTLKNCLQTATQELDLLYKKVGLKRPLTLAEEDDKLFMLESQLNAAKKEIEALQSEVTLSSNEQEMMINNLFLTLQNHDRQVQLQNEIITLLRDFIQKAQNEHQQLLVKCDKVLVPKVSSVGEHKSMLQMKLKSYEVQLQAQEELINTLKESLEKAHQDLEEAFRETESERRLSLQEREHLDSQKVVNLQSSVNQLKREMVKYQDMITTLEEKEQLPVSQSMDIRQALLQRKLEAQDRQIEAQGQMIQSYKDALKQTQQEFQELIKDADLTKQLEIQTLEREGERKVEELQTVLKEVQLDLAKEKSKISSISQSQFTFLTSQMEKYKSQINTQDEMIHVLRGSLQSAKDEYEEIIRTNKNHQVSTDETKHINQQRIRELEDKLKETKEKLLSNQAQIEMLEREKSLPKSHSVQLHNTFLMSELEASERKVKTQAALISALEDSAKKITEEYDQTLTKIKAEDRLTMEQLKLEEQYKIQGLQETLEKAHKQLEEQTSLPKSRSIIERNNALKAALDSRNAQIDAQNEIIDALRNTIQKIKHDYGEIINKAQQEIKVSSEAKEKEFEQRINELNRELTFANEKMNTYQAQIQAFEEKEVPAKSQSLEMLNALLTSKLETSEKKVATQSELIHTLQESIQRTKEENETMFERRSGNHVTFEDAQQLDEYKMQTLQKVSSNIQGQLKEQSHLPESTSSQLHNAHLVLQLETYDKQIDTQREMIELLQNSLQKAKGQLQENFQIQTQVRDSMMTESRQETEETIQELESSLLKVQDELTKYKQLGEVLEKEGAIPDNRSFEFLDILLASKLHTAEAQVEDQTELIKVLMETISLTATESKALLKETKSDRRPSLEEKQMQDENMILQLQTQLKDIQQDLHKTINMNQENEIKIQDELMSTLRETLNKTQKEFQNFLQTSNKDKKESLEKIEQENNQKIDALQALLQEEQANVHTYKQQIEMLEKEKLLPKSQSANLQVALLTSKLENVEKQVEAKDQLIQVLKESIQTLRDEYNIMIKNTASEWRIVVEENQRANDQKIQQLQDNLSQVRTELESSQDMIQTLEEQMVKTDTLLPFPSSTKTISNDDAKVQLSFKNQDIQKLIYSLKSVQTELTQLQNIHQECGNATIATRQLNAAQDEVQALKAKITTFEAQEEPRKQEDKREEILSLHSQLATATSNLKAREGVIANQQEMINILQESCKLHEKEIKELQTKTNKLAKEREQIDEEHKKLKYESDGQQAQLLGLQEVLLTTKQQLQDMQGKGYEPVGKTECNTHELERMRHQLRSLNRDLDSLKFQICSKERDIKLLEEYRQKYIFLRKVETQYVALKRDYNHLSLEHKRLLNVLRTEVKDNIDYLKEQLIQLDADNTILRTDNERLIGELDNALVNYQEIRNQETSLSALLLHCENGKESLQKELCSLSLQVSQHTEINNLNTDHVNKLEGIISELNIYIDTLKQEMNTASQKHEDEMYLLKQQNEEMTNINVELMNELAKLRDQIKHHEVQISKSERRVDAAQKEVDQCKEVIKVLREKMELTNKRNNEVKELRARLTQAEANYHCYLDKTLKQQETLIESAKREVTLQQHLTDKEKELLTQLRLAKEQEAKMTELVDMLNSELSSVKEEVREKDTQLQLNITKLQTITTEREKLQKDCERSAQLNLKLQQGLSHANMSLVRTMESMEEKDSVLNSLQLQLSQLTEACQHQDDCEHDVTSEQLLFAQKEAQRLTAEVGRLTKLQEASNAEVRGFLEAWWWDDFWQAW